MVRAASTFVFEVDSISFASAGVSVGRTFACVLSAGADVDAPETTPPEGAAAAGFA
jgi:hypothetical protein